MKKLDQIQILHDLLEELKEKKYQELKRSNGFYDYFMCHTNVIVNKSLELGICCAEVLAVLELDRIWLSLGEGFEIDYSYIVPNSFIKEDEYDYRIKAVEIRLEELKLKNN